MTRPFSDVTNSMEINYSIRCSSNPGLSNFWSRAGHGHTWFSEEEESPDMSRDVAVTT